MDKETPITSDEQYDTTATAEKRKKNFRNHVIKPLAVFAITGAAIFGISEANAGPEFSHTTTTHTVESGEGLLSATNDIEGINMIDPREAVAYIESLKQNEKVLQDGLQPGEQITIPVSVQDK